MPRVGTRNPRCWSLSKMLTNDFETCLLGPRDQPLPREVPSRQLCFGGLLPSLPSLPCSSSSFTLGTVTCHEVTCGQGLGPV